MEKKWVYLLLGLVLIFFIGTIISPVLFEKSLNPGAIKNSIQSFGFWAPLIFVLLILVVCIFSIIPVAPFIIAAGYLFGIFYGFLYSLLALSIGMSLVFLLGKKFGRPFAEKITDKKKIRKFDAFFHKWGIWALVIQRLIPFYPVNVMGFSLGISKMKYRTFITVYLAMTVPGLILQTYLGNLTSYIEQINLKILIIAGILITLFILMSALFFKGRIKKWVIKEIEILEKDFEKMEKKKSW